VQINPEITVSGLVPVFARAMVVAVLVHQAPSHAYIDPGTGSLVLQGLIAFIVGATFALKNFYRTKVKAFLDFILRRPAPKDDPADADPKT